MFERFGRVTRVFLAKDRETGRAKGFAFISFQERTDAARACEKMDGCTWSVLSPFPFTSQFLHMLISKRWIWAPDLEGRICQAVTIDASMNPVHP